MRLSSLRGDISDSIGVSIHHTHAHEQTIREPGRRVVSLMMFLSSVLAVVSDICTNKVHLSCLYVLVRGFADFTAVCQIENAESISVHILIIPNHSHIFRFEGA